MLNVADPKAASFVKDILDEPTELFPFRYIHLGGDECPTTAWKGNETCRKLLQSLNSTNYRDLQTHFFKEIEQYLTNKKNPGERRNVIAWNETLEDDLTGSNVTVMAWINWVRDSKRAAEKGLDVIMTPYSPYYINRRQWPSERMPDTQGNGKETLEAVYAYEPVPEGTSLEAVYAYEPVPEGTSLETEAHYKGVQANLWTERVTENRMLEYLMLPRLIAVAEAG